ncbi:1,4-alpha-glucan branching protein GlgB [Hutsoniella sourekii]
MNIKSELPDNIMDDIYYFNKGVHRSAYKFFGSKRRVVDGEIGYQFTVWAPNANNVSIQGDFTQWHLVGMNRLDGGVWTIYFSGDVKGDKYKYAVDNGRGHVEYKLDPFSYRNEISPKDASIVWDLPKLEWADQEWMANQNKERLFKSPIQIYEVHPGSWRRHPDGREYNLTELADALVPYVKDMGYTHIELMPVMEHPLDASWGYQITGYYAVNGRYGKPEDLHYFVDLAHQNGIGVMVDWVPGHYSRNSNGLAYFDGTPCYEYEDSNKANNVGWGALNFDLGKNQVQSFLISNAMYWLKEYHLDGIRVDAVTNMLYLDFDDKPWTPNEDGSNHNRQGVEFIKKLNQTIHEECPHVLTMAEESTDWKGATHPVEEGGLGFDYKWNMGWMNDTLKFIELDPVYRPASLRLITFAFMYQYNERYILPFSHDEVVHGKRSMLDKFPLSRRDQFANLRLLYGYKMAQPGKKLNFMGNELGQYLEWRFNEELDWAGLQQEFNKEYQYYIRTLNHLGLAEASLHELDHDPLGMQGIDADDLEEGVLSFLRRSSQEDDFMVCVFNFTPVERNPKRIGVPYPGDYQVVLNSELEEFGGRWTHTHGTLTSQAIPSDGFEQSIELIVPGFAALFIKPETIDLQAQDHSEKDSVAKVNPKDPFKTKSADKAKAKLSRQKRRKRGKKR